MTTNQLNRVIRFIKKTGDQAVVLDPASDDVLVLMSLDKYEDITAEPEWFDDDTNDEDGNDDPFGDLPPSPEPFSPGDETVSFSDDLPVDEALERETVPPVPEKKQPLEFGNNWAEHNVSASLEESLADVPHEPEEEKFYLEPVE